MDTTEMDAAAEEAKNEIEGWSAAATGAELAAWYARWYLKAGHKRLGRILVELAKFRVA